MRAKKGIHARKEETSWEANPNKALDSVQNSIKGIKPWFTNHQTFPW